MTRPRPGRETPHGDPTERELAAIAERLKTLLPMLESPPPPEPVRRPKGSGRSLALFLAGSLVPGLVLVAIMLAFGPRL